MKKKKFFKNKTQMIIYIILFIIFIALFIYFGTFEKTTKKSSDSDKFKNEYKEVNEDNIYVYLNGTETLDYIKNDNVIILFGVKNNSYVGFYANILNEVAKNIGIEKIYYYDLTEDRKMNNGTYQSIVNYLKDYAVSLDDGSKNIYAPTLIVKCDGIVTYFDDEDAIIHGDTNASDYFDNYRTNLKKITLKSVLEDYKKNEDK